VAYYSGPPIADGPVEIRSPDFDGFRAAHDQADIDTSYWYREAATAANMLYFAVVLAPEGTPVGEVVLHDIDPAAGTASVHTHLFKRQYRVHGLGEHAMRAVVEYAFQHARLKRLTLVVGEDNFPARRCYAKCGFEQVDRLEADRSKLVMALTREQWRRMMDEEQWER
jgi:RimJ/RimL family protein N-acetyltransferase